MSASNTGLTATITFLEMLAPPSRRYPPPANFPLALMKADDIPLHFYRYLYETIGADHYWIDRKFLDDEALSALIHADTTEIMVLYCGGVPAGYFELAGDAETDIELAYLGIMPDFVGRGLGRYLLTCALDRAWAKEPRRVHIQTNTLDHPAALQLYQKVGFVPFAQETRTFSAEEVTGKA